MTDIAPTTFTPTTFTPTTVLSDYAQPADLADPSANDLDKDAFLQLLVAQLRYQDPLNPNDPSEFMATTAQFTVVEKLDELTRQGENTAIISGLSMASSLVGRTVTYVGGDDAVTTGLVSSAQVSNGEVTLVTDSGAVDLSTVIGIGATAGADGPSGSSNPGTTTQPTHTPADAAPGAAPTSISEPVAEPSPSFSQPPAASEPTPVETTPVEPTPVAPSDIGIPHVEGLPSAPVAIPPSLFNSRPETPSVPDAVPTQSQTTTP